MPIIPARWRRLVLMMAASALTLALGFWLKLRCVGEPTGIGYEFRNFCYSDTYFHWEGYGFAAGAVPYVTHWNEYPALTGTFSYLVSLAATDVAQWWKMHAVSLLAFGLLATYALYRMGHDWRSAAPWVLAPTIVVSGFTNYDMWTLGFLALGLWMFHDRRWGLAGLFIGLGCAGKLFPGFLWPPMALALAVAAVKAGNPWRTWGAYRDAGRLTTGFLLGVVPLNLYYAARNAVTGTMCKTGRLDEAGLPIFTTDCWLETWRFQAARGTTWESLHMVLDQRYLQPAFGHTMTVAEMNALAAVLFFGGSAAILLPMLRRRSTDAFVAATAIVALYLFSAKVYSGQHTLWILLLLVAARMPTWTWVALTFTDLVTLVWVYHLYTPSLEGGNSYEYVPLIQFWVAMRLLALLAILVVAVKRLNAPQRDAGGVPDGGGKAAGGADADAKAAARPLE